MDTFSKSLTNGNHTVELTVKDRDGETGTAFAQFQVKNVPPVAKIDSPDNHDEFFEGDEIEFNATSSYDPEGDDLDFDWDFGDNSTHGDEAVVSHTYDIPGEYDVNLTVSDELDQTTRKSISITIKSKGPTASFTANMTDARVNENITFDAEGSTAPGGSEIVNYTWDFDDGTIIENNATNTTAEHNWTAAGYYNVTLTVTDSGNLTNETTLMVKIIPLDFHDEETNGQVMGPGGSGEDQWDFPVQIFHFEVEVNITISSNLNTIDFEIELLDDDDNQLWHESDSVGGGQDIQYQLNFGRNDTNDSIGQYHIDISVSVGIAGGSVNWDYIVDIRYQ